MDRTQRSAIVRRTVKLARRNGCQFVNIVAVRKLAGVHFTINEAAQLRCLFDKHSEDGKIAIVRSGMDCDCSQYLTIRHIEVPVSVRQFMLEEEKHREYLDGPEQLSIGNPSKFKTGHKSRDRALEAFEDGHPHYVTFGDIDD